jgi:amino acid adenylation domain-containing protein
MEVTAQSAVDLAELGPESAEAAQVAAALLALHYVTHDDTPAITVHSARGEHRTVSVLIEPAESFGALIDKVAGSAGPHRPTGNAISFGEEPQDPAGARLHLVVNGTRADCAHDGSPGAELDADTLVSVYRKTLDQGLRVLSQSIRAHELLAEQDRHRVLTEFNDTAREFPEDQTLHGIFRAQAARTPEAVAISADDGTAITYRELDERTDRLAGHLIATGVRPGQVVAVLSERCAQLPVAIIAVLKARAAYLPLDPAAPRLRVADMLERSGAAVVLAQPGAAVPDSVTATVLRMDDPALAADPSASLPTGADSRDAAYVIYTSGSTGRPKAVVVEHRSVVNRLTWMQRRYPLSEQDTLLQKTPIVFDVSVWELFWWFFAGARLHMLSPGMERFPLAIAKTVRAQRVTVLHFVPSMLGMFLDHLRGGRDQSVVDGLRWVFASGETLPPAAVTTFAEVFGTGARGARLVNLYGPTEATVDVTGHDCPLEPCTGQVPIGAPIDNTRVYVLREGRPMPVGVYGTLFLAGVGVARGYLGDPELTARRFVPEYGGGPGTMYDTGDIGRWLPSGELEFLGRTDTQVKIRGIRIDLGEIENVLLEVPGLVECVVLVDHPDPARPVLRAALSGSPDLAAGHLREHAALRLPQYMVPTAFHLFPGLPRTASGKLDRRLLALADYVEEHGTAL